MVDWNPALENQKAIFMERLLSVYQPPSRCYSGLWQKFCLQEAGPVSRSHFFDFLNAIEQYENKTKGTDNTKSRE